MLKKVRIFRIEEVDFCTAFLGGVPLNNICGLMKGYMCLETSTRKMMIKRSDMWSVTFT